MTDNERFFYDNAGWSYDTQTETSEEGRERCAVKLAEAELWAKAEGVKVEWVIDNERWDADCDCEAPEEIFGCILTLGEESVSLWSIGDPDEDDKRVFEAELASELRICFFEALANHIRSL